MQAATESDLAEPTDAADFLERGIAHVRAGQHESALTDLAEALRLDPTLARAHKWRGIALYDRSEYPAAVTEFTAAIVLDGQDASVLTWRGAAHAAQDLIDDALNDFDAAIRLNPDDANAFLNRGRAHDRIDDIESAIEDYTDVIRLAPDEVEAYLWRGIDHYRLDADEAALTDLGRFIEADPEHSGALVWRASVWNDTDQPQRAIDDLTQALRLNPLDARAFRSRGETWAAIGEYTAALADYTAAVRLDPENSSAFRGRAEVWAELGNHANAESDLQAADDLDSRTDEPMPERRTLIHPLLQSHFVSIPFENLTITERNFPGRVRADLQGAIDTLLEQMQVRHFCAVRKRYAHEGISFVDLLVRDPHDPPLSVPPQYEEIDIGEAQPLRRLTDGLWLLEDEGHRFAVFLGPVPAHQRGCGMRFQVATADNETGARITQKFFQHLERAVQEARCYRGKILSLEYGDGYSGTSTGIKVHKLRAVAREQVILPLRTLNLLDRNVIEFVRQRPQLAALGLATKKGLLFYGPPGTGKTHTIHYLAGALPGMTTLLISAEQVGLLGEYMTLARLLQPSMIVIEDADLIARERTRMGSACEELLLNTLLNEMDGLKEQADILFILTTNRPETLEAALSSRPGRIDQAIEFPFPDTAGRTKLVRLYSHGLSVPEAVVEATVARTENVSPAFIKELMRRAAQFHLERDGAATITQADVDNALDELLFSGGSLNRKLLGAQVE